jgi:hypothetical protein
MSDFLLILDLFLIELLLNSTKLFDRLMIFLTYLLIFFALSNHAARIGKVITGKFSSAILHV